VTDTVDTGHGIGRYAHVGGGGPRSLQLYQVAGTAVMLHVRYS